MSTIQLQVPCPRHEWIGSHESVEVESDANSVAICDRIVHAAERIELKGESVRKLYAQRTKEQEVGEK